MQCHGKDKTNAQSEAYKRIVLLGTPNVGKSVIFGLLTGKYATVSNYPGTTVEVFYGNMRSEGKGFLIVDTPGVNSLIPMSEDERVTRDILLNERPALVCQVGDAKNLRRTLLLTLQLSEMGLPVALDLNMSDEAIDRGIAIDHSTLSSILKTTVVGTVAPERKGFKELKSAISGLCAEVPALKADYGALLEEYIENVSFLLPDANISKRSLAVMILCGDKSLREWLNSRLSLSVLNEIEALKDECQMKLKRPVSAIVAEQRLRIAEDIAQKVEKKAAPEGGRIASIVGNISMHPIWGVPMLLLVLFGLYEFVGVLGADIMVGFFEEKVFGEYLNPMFTRVVQAIVPVKFFQDMLIGEYGAITMAITYAIAIILPITTTFFIAFSILEDSGYLPRLAIMTNKVFKLMGLSGKAVLPMVLGLGCGTMAVMTTRILESRRERVIATFLLALAVPCAAQLGVIMGLLGGVSGWAMAIWISSIIIMLLIAGFLASKLVKGEEAEFFLEIPPIRMPTFQNVAVKTWGRAVWYLKEAVPLFILGTFALFLLDKIKVLGIINNAASPVVVGVLGLPAKATEAFLIGFFRRDYGAAGLFAMSEQGLLEPIQIVVSLVTLTLFVPCLAHFFMMIKERGMRYALITMAIILPIAVGAGGVLNAVLRALNVRI